MRPPLDLRGERYGRLVALQRQQDGRWLCQCDCGQRTIVRLNNLRSGRTQSCGCLHKEIMSGGGEVSVSKPKNPDSQAREAFAAWNRCTARDQSNVLYALDVMAQKHASLKDCFQAAQDVLKACTLKKK